MAYTTSHLTTHEAITDTIHRFVYGIDDADPDLIRSAFTEDAVFDLTPLRNLNPKYGETVGRDKIVAQLSHVVGPLDTTHMVVNVRTELAPADSDGVSRRARVTALALAQHWRPGQGPSPDFGSDYLNGNRYDCEVVFDGDVWRFQRFKLMTKWAKGDRGVMNPDGWKQAGDFAKLGLEEGEKRL